jgi:hypothetical protein
MACRVTRRRRVVCAGTMHPEWQRAARRMLLQGTEKSSFLRCAVDGAAVACAPGTRSAIAAPLRGGVMSRHCSCSSPNVFGNHRGRGRDAAAAAHEVGALLAVATNPILLGVLESPGAQGADIVVGEGQCTRKRDVVSAVLRLGVFACREQHVRQMPGRLVGRTVDLDGRIGVRTHALHARAAYTPREGDEQHLQQSGAVCACGRGLPQRQSGVRDSLRLQGRVHRERHTTCATGCLRRDASRHHGTRRSRTSSRLPTRAMCPPCMPRCSSAVSWRESPLSRLGSGASDGAAADPSSTLVLFAVTEKRTRAEMDTFAEEVCSL